jgi:hypothetical protein
MKCSATQKVTIVIVTVGVITFFVVELFKNKSKALTIHQEMMTLITLKNELDTSSKLGQIEPEFEPYGKQEGFSNIIEGLDIGKEMRKTFEKPFNKMKEEIGGPLNEIFGIVKKINDAFNSIPRRARALQGGFEKSVKGIELEFVNLGKSLDIGFSDIFDLIGTVGKCGIDTIKNIRTCMIWYIIDLIGSTLYSIIVVLPVFITRMITGFDLQPFVDIVNNTLEYIDSLFFDYTCYLIFHLSDWVTKLCYTCKYQEKVDKIIVDFHETIPKLLDEPGQKFKEAKHDFDSIFK